MEPTTTATVLPYKPTEPPTEPPPEPPPEPPTMPPKVDWPFELPPSVPPCALLDVRDLSATLVGCFALGAATAFALAYFSRRRADA